MPFFGELQRDRVTLLLTLNVLLFVGYAAGVVMLVAVPSLWLVTFLLVGFAYNVIELWLNSPYRQSQNPVGMRARTHVKPTAVVAPPKLGRAHRTDPVLGVRVIAGGRESLAQRLAELQASKPPQTAPAIEIATRSVSASTAMEPTEAGPAVASELSVELLEDSRSELVEIISESNITIAPPIAAESTAMIMTSVVAANETRVADIPDTEPLVLNAMADAAVEAAEQAPSIGSETPSTTSEAAMEGDASKPRLVGVEPASVRPEVRMLNTEEIIPPSLGPVFEPVFESVAEEIPAPEPLLPQVDNAISIRLPEAAAVSGDRLEGAAAPSVDVVAGPAVARISIPAVTHLAGRRREVVDIVIASIVSDAKRPQPLKQPVVDARPAVAAKARTPSESLAMLRNELAKTRGNPSAAVQAKAPGAARKPLGAARKPGKSPADGTRDRVMFVWHGRHFLAPIEGRHPLRVAQSLYDFMVEEAMEHG